MKFEERTITLKDGRTCVLKPNAPEYAAEMIEYMTKTAAETEYLLRYPDEVNFTVEKEKEILGNILEDAKTLAKEKNAKFILVFENDKFNLVEVQ